MSDWTYILGTITVVSIGRSSAETKYILESVLDHLPTVTGSEGDMQVHYLPSCYGGIIRNRNEFGQKRKWMHSKEFYETEFSSRNTFKNQFNVIIEANLRDREFEFTKRELMKWLCRLSKRVLVEDLLVKLSDQLGRTVILSDPEPFNEMWEQTSWNSKGRKIAWWEYLFWEPDPLSDMPLKLVWKYLNDPIINAEMQRRLEWAERMRRNKEQQESDHE